jgi:hypothetical protein
MAIRPTLGILCAPLLSAVTVLVGCGQSSNPNTNADGGGGGDAGRGGASSGGSASSGSGGGSGSGGSGSGGSGSGSSSGTGSDGGTSSGSGSSGGSSSSGGTASGTSVFQHHTNPTRDGVYTDAAMNKMYAGTLKLSTTFAPTITGNVYAQPLYVSDGPGGKEAFIVATEQNHVMAIDGTGATIWQHPSSSTDTTSYGTPVTNVRTALGCGNIDPLGITGTPVIDPTTRTIYFDAMTSAGGTPTHKIYGVSLDDGTIKSGWPVTVDTAVSGFVSKPHNERGALALQNGVLYVPYGGHNGDCGMYNGWVVGVNVSNPTSVTAFSTGTTFGSRQAGIWAVGGVVSTMDGMSLFVSTGNTGGASSWAGGEAVLRLDPGPKFSTPATAVNEFHPMEWMAEDGRDEDLGGANPVVFDMPSAPAGAQHLVAIPGKDGYLYVLNRDSLGGMAGQLSRTQVGPLLQGGTGALNGAPAAYTTAKGTYVAYHIKVGGNGTSCPSGGPSGSIGVAQLMGNPPTPKVIWCSAEGNLGSPMVTTNGMGDVIVWDANTHLYGYDGDTGIKVFDGTSFTMAASMHYFNSPIDAAGRMVVATSPGHLYMFKP